MIELLAWVLLFPFLGFLILALVGNRLSKALILWVGVGSVALAALLAALIAAEFLNGDMWPYRLVLGHWLDVGELSLVFGFYLDALSMTMLLVVTGVGFLIHLYSAGFMASDPGYARFFAYMNLFVAAMLLLVLADNLALLYLGWEGVGLGSYLLIGFWYREPGNGYAARKAFVMTRVGDTAMLLGLLLLFVELDTLDIQAVVTQAAWQWMPGSRLPVTASALLLGGAVGKSAQLPLQTWLPDAMAGPTPVSALIHAAIMVTAGVYLIARTHGLFELAPSVQFAVAMIGTITLLTAGCAALAQTDIKRLLAYSTISQIGYMFLGLGVGAWSAAIFHLLTHAFFKALLFLAAGAVILRCQHQQDIFKLGGLRKAMPLAFWSFVIGCMALSALPFSSGFYSKHEILLAAYRYSPGLWAAGCLGALITGVYSFRLLFTVFFGREVHRLEKHPDWRISLPLFLFCALALFGAMLRIPLDSVFPVTPGPEPGVDLISGITVVTPLIGLTIAVLSYLTGTLSVQGFANAGLIKPIRQCWLNGWGMDALYDLLLVRPFKAIARRNKHDAIDGLYAAITSISRVGHLVLRATQTGRIRWYASSMALGVAVIIAIGCLS